MFEIHPPSLVPIKFIAENNNKMIMQYSNSRYHFTFNNPHGFVTITNPKSTSIRK